MYTVHIFAKAFHDLRYLNKTLLHLMPLISKPINIFCLFIDPFLKYLGTNSHLSFLLIFKYYKTWRTCPPCCSWTSPCGRNCSRTASTTTTSTVTNCELGRAQ